MIVIDDDNVVPEPMERRPTLIPEPDYERIELLDWSQLMVEIRSLVFGFSRRKPFLNGVDMSVPKSAIYGLLGPSGCGKTTLLRLILGLIRPKSGTIKVNGKRPGDPKNNIPGAGVGFMPQDLALYQEFTLKEALKYFGRNYGMSDEQILSRITFLVDFLDLPDPERQIRHMSGGQKRRVSLSISLVHNPPLLLLDEPTVGTDPLLRERIWEYLVVLSRKELTTVIITTHYIEEARRAHVISLMRDGELLVEHSPQYLLRHFNVQNLEEVFLKMCRHEINNKDLMPKNFYESKSNTNNNNNNDKNIIIINGKDSKASGQLMATKRVTYVQRVLNQTSKNYIRLVRNKPLLVFQTILPTICIILFCLCIGSKPFNIKIALFNQEYTKDGYHNFSPNDPIFSDFFLREIDNKTIIIKHYNSFDSALDAVKTSDEVHGALIIPPMFTWFLMARFFKDSATEDVISNSTVRFYGDLTDMILTQTIMKALVDAQLKFMGSLVDKAITNGPNVTTVKGIFDPIIKFVDPPVFGSLDPKFRDFMAPGVMLSIIYIMAVGLTALAIVVERKDGQLERSMVSGVRQHEILIAQVLLEFGIVSLQTILMMTFTFLVFEVPNKGNIVLVMLIILLQGLTGMTFGLLISSVCYDENSAIMASLGSFYPILLLSGIMWPLEGMPFGLRQVSYVLPQTLPIISLRNVMLKGWDVTRTFVYLGFFSTIVWMIVLLIIATIVMRFKNNN